jgi:Tfp pilus assembly protein PilN
LEQTAGGVKVKGSTSIPEVVPNFMEALRDSGIFAGVDIEIIERRNEISNFSIVCTGRN